MKHVHVYDAICFECIIYKTITNIIKHTKSYNWFCYDDVNDNAQCALSLVLQWSSDVIIVSSLDNCNTKNKAHCAILFTSSWQYQL